MAVYSGIYLHYEGTDSECSGIQRQRELTWAEDIGASGALRYVDCNNDHHYINANNIVESGPYTPYVKGFTSVVENNCYYYKVGDMVHVILNISGTVALEGTEVELPFPARSNIKELGKKILTGYIDTGGNYIDYPTACIEIIHPTGYANVQPTEWFYGLDTATTYGGPAGVHKWLCGSFWYIINPD